LFAISLTIKKSEWTVTMSRITLLIAILGSVLIARTGYLGGKIRHTEITNVTTTEQPAGSQQQGENEDD